MDTIYVLTNPALNGMVKIGWTSRSVRERVAELSTTGVPAPFGIGFCLYVRDGLALEKYLHAKYHAKRCYGNREFFSVDVDDVKIAIEDWECFGSIAHDEGMDVREDSEFRARACRVLDATDIHAWIAKFAKGTPTMQQIIASATAGRGHGPLHREIANDLLDR